MDIEFTIVIPSYNRAAYIKKAIESVIQQTYKKWKLLIVDDASTDNTVQKITPYLQDPQIRLIGLPENQGISSVLNIALANIDTDYFVQLDSDDCLSRDTLEQFQKAIQKDNKAAVYYGNVAMWMKNENGAWVKRRTIRHRNFKNKYDFLVYLTYMLHPRCYRTEAVREVGGWDTQDAYQGRMMEDRRMCVKLIERYPFHWINKVLYHRRKHREQLTSKKMFRARNQLRKELVISSLKNWGGKYKPVFGFRGGLLTVRRLVPINSVSKGTEIEKNEK